MQTARDDDLTRHGFLLLGFDLLVAAVVAMVVTVMFPATVPMVGAIVLAVGGVLCVMAAFVAVRGPSGTSGGRRAPG